MRDVQNLSFYWSWKEFILPDDFISNLNNQSKSQMMSTAKVVIYGAAYCSFCVKAKNLLVKNNVPVNWIDVEVE